MLKVSAPAGVRMTDLLNPRAEDAVLRIVRGKDRYKLHVSSVRPGDQTFAHDGRVVLALDERAQRSLSGRVLDIRQTKSGPRLKLKAR